MTSKLSKNSTNFLTLQYFLVKFSYWPKFHVNIMLGVMTIFVNKELSRNPKIGNIPVWVLSNIWRLGQVRDTKFGTNVSNKMLLNTSKCQGYSFYRFWFIKRKPKGGRYNYSPAQISVKYWVLVKILFGKIFWKYL